MSAAAYTGWALLELMGHRQRIGRVSEVEAYGGKLLRIDIPVAEGEGVTESHGPCVTEFYGASSVYALRPLSEAVALAMVKQYGDPRPVMPMDYRIEDRSGAGGRAAGSYDDDDPEDLV